MWTCFVAEYACISVVTELDDSFRSGIFSLVSSFQRDVLHAPCSFSDNQCLQWHEMRCHCWCQSYLAWKLPHHACVSVRDAASASPRARSCCHVPSSTQLTRGELTAASCNPEWAFPVELTCSEDGEIIYCFIGRDSLSSAVFSLRSRKLTVML